MDASGFVEWTWALPDTEKPALSSRVAAVRSNTDVRYLAEARSSAEAATVENGDFDKHWTSLGASTYPQDWMDRDMEAWNLKVGNDLREAYRDTLLALVAGNAIGKGHRRALADPLLPEVPGISEALGLV